VAIKLIDVVVPVYGKIPLVLRLLDSLRNQSRLGQIIIVDDSSPDADREVLKTITGVKIFRNAGNEGFPKSCNRGVSKSDAPYVLILNSDTEATHPHCIERMAENLDDGAAVCGSLLIYPKNDPYGRADRIQHAGVMYDADGFPLHIMAGMHYTNPAAQARRSINTVTGACMMVKRDWWEKLGGFDLGFGMGTFEDCDFTLRTRKLGGEVIYEPKAMWYHAEHASQGQNGNWFSRENLNRNFSYLLRKHGEIKSDANLFFKGC
jgi:GT2 family glycosyltransferase